MKRLTNNLGLKILALVLAVLIYYAMRTAMQDPALIMKGPSDAVQAR